MIQLIITELKLFTRGRAAVGLGASVGFPSRGFGLIAMRQRIEGLAGTLRIESGAGAGTGISACIPAAPAEPAA